MESATGVYRDELLEKIIGICSQDKYKYVTDFEWYLNILYDLTQIKGITNGALIRDQMLDVCVRAPAIREDAVTLMTDLLDDPNIISEVRYRLVDFVWCYC
jgi:AP-3 complex subunit delta-1